MEGESSEFFGDSFGGYEGQFDDEGACYEPRRRRRTSRSAWDELPFELGTVWVRPEVFVGWIEGFSVPPLVTTSPQGTARADAGVLGEPNTSIVVGNERLVEGARAGGRIQFGAWLDPCERLGVQASFFAFGQETDVRSFDSDDFAILARPFFNVEEGIARQDAELVAFPQLLSGQIEVRAESDFHGFEVMGRKQLAAGCYVRVDCLAGWRNLSLDEELLIRDQKTTLAADNGLPAGTSLSEFDRFSTENRFNGAQVGVIAEMRRCCWTLETALKLALGNTHSQVDIDGQTVVRVPLQGGGVDEDTTPAGLLAQETNIGTYEQDDFAVVPELSVNLGYELTCNLRVTVGYTFLYWSRVARPGDQIDTDLNLTQLDGALVGVPRPQFNFVSTDVWAQALSLGVDYRF
jgi:hypothetical protein